MFLLLALLPSAATVLSLVLLVPFLVSRAWARAEAPMQAEPMPGWALALDAELEAVEWVDAIDTLWVEETVHVVEPEPCPATERMPCTLRTPTLLDRYVTSPAYLEMIALAEALRCPDIVRTRPLATA